MSYPVYYPIEDDTLPIFWDSFDGGTGASITMSGLAATDIEIYKDGGTTQRASDNGYTLLDTDGTDFDGITGIHGISIDLSDNSDAGFYAVGPWYHVVISSVTIDGQTVNFVAAAFRILDATRGMSGTALPDAAADAAGGLPISDAGGLDLDTQIGTDIDAILTDTNEMQGKLPTNNIMGSSDTDNHDTDIDAILADTNELQGDWADGGRLDLLLDAALADTNELQTDWADGGRLDLLIDAIKVETDKLGDAHAEPTGAPAANETPLDKIGYLFMALRNRVHVDSDSIDFYDDGDAVEFSKAVTDDGTDYNEAEAA